MALAVSLNGDLVPIPPAGGGAPSGPAGGDLSGTYPNPSVLKVNGVAAGTYSINSQVNSYTLALSDIGKFVIGADGKTITIPPNATIAFPIGSWVDIGCSGPLADQVNLTGGAGVTFKNSIGGLSGVLVIVGSQRARVIKTATDTWETQGVPIVPPSGLLKGNGAGAITTAILGSDYAPATTGSALLKADGAGGFTAAVPGVDYVTPDQITFAAILAAAGITPDPDGTTTPVTSITTKTGVVTAVS